MRKPWVAAGAACVLLGLVVHGALGAAASVRWSAPEAIGPAPGQPEFGGPQTSANASGSGAILTPQMSAGPAGPRVVLSALRLAAGRRVGVPQRLELPYVPGAWHAAAGPRGEVVVAVDTSGPNGLLTRAVWAAVFRDGAWQAPVELSTPLPFGLQQPSDSMVCVDRTGRAYVGWTEGDPNAPGTTSATLAERAPDGSWAPPQRLPAAPGVSNYLAALACGSARPLAAWVDKSPAIQTAERGPTGWQPAGQVPAAAGGGRRRHHGRHRRPGAAGVDVVGRPRGRLRRADLVGLARAGDLDSGPAVGAPRQSGRHVGAGVRHDSGRPGARRLGGDAAGHAACRETQPRRDDLVAADCSRPVCGHLRLRPRRRGARRKRSGRVRHTELHARPLRPGGRFACARSGLDEVGPYDPDRSPGRQDLNHGVG